MASTSRALEHLARSYNLAIGIGPERPTPADLDLADTIRSRWPLHCPPCVPTGYHSTDAFLEMTRALHPAIPTEQALFFLRRLASGTSVA